jgi:hypothetical protein
MGAKRNRVPWEKLWDGNAKTTERSSVAATLIVDSIRDSTKSNSMAARGKRMSTTPSLRLCIQRWTLTECGGISSTQSSDTEKAKAALGRQKVGCWKSSGMRVTLPGKRYRR